MLTGTEKDFQTKKALSELIEFRNAWYEKWINKIDIKKFIQPHICTKENTIEDPKVNQLYIDINMVNIEED